ncbi:autotransporter outer membrane beta-barrel domain-containing protein [Microvirga antarctica]|uniref:autotransporter outer membrane beta-barrel domain-containing protein n=1 Tax=Microvirga antarctica TaxID=2819233 RepID=UPI001FE715A3|nr:autotransporter outer membrane beta-barrel domain-containing protein [Microvirga antarctica]
MKNNAIIRRRLLSSCARFAIVGSAFCALGSAAQAQAPTPYTTLNFGTTGTFLTGIRGTNIVGNYVVPGTTATGGLLYNMTSGQWSAMPVATANGVNFPDAIGSSPYGPSFGNPNGVLRTVGSYLTTASSPYDLSYLYDGAAAPGRQITPLAYPSAPGNPTLFTIAHSTFGDTVVGNYDTRLATGNAAIYTISTGTYVTNNKPGAVSTTAYGVYGDMIAGGYANVGPGGGIGFEHGYLYNKITKQWSTYDHPAAIITHLEGITGAGRSGEYNMVADWVTADGVVHAGVLHVNALGIPTWYEINIPGATLVSSNSAYGDKVVGIYLLPGSTTPNGYVATIPGIYNPISNTGALTSSASNAAALSGRKGDDIVNSGTVRVSGRGGIGIRGETYGVLTNSGTVVATGGVGAAVEMHGLYGTLLNSGTLQAPAVADALRTGPDSFGSVIVNTGIIDGRIAATAGPEKRFENSGWIGVTGTGIPITHLLSGIYAQTSAGTLSLRVGDDGNDALGVTGIARLAGTLSVPFQTSTLSNTYPLLLATGGMTGTFTTLITSGLPSFVSASLAYSDTRVALNLTSQMAQQSGLTFNQASTGGAVDRAFNAGTLADTGNATASALGRLYGLSASQLPAALGSLSGEIHASEQSVLVNDGVFTRELLLSRLRQLSYDGTQGAESALGYSGDMLSYRADPRAAPKSAGGTFASASKAPLAYDRTAGLAVWAQGYGSWGNLDRNGNASSVSTTLGGVVGGFDKRIGADTYLGGALGYSQSTTSIGALASSAQADSGLVAAYAGSSFGAFKVRGGMSYTLSQVDTSRVVVFPGVSDSAHAQYNAGLFQMFGEVGYGIALGKVALEPFAGLAWAHLDSRSFTESAASIGLTGGGASPDVGYTTLGLRLATEMVLGNGMVLVPHASIGWQHAFGDVTPAARMGFAGIAGSPLSVTGVPLATNSALLDVGATLQVTDAVKLNLSYIGQLADGAQQNAVKGGLTWNF